MKTWSASALAIIASETGFRVTAVRLLAADGTAFLWTDHHDSITVTCDIDGTPTALTFLPRVLERVGEPEWSNPNSAVETVQVSDDAGTLRALARAEALRDQRILIWDLWSADPSGGWWPVEIFDGSVERVGVGDDAMVEIQAGPSLRLWAGSAPRIVSCQCPYTSTTECPYVESCPKSYAACTANAKTDIFGGNLYLTVAGTQIEFHDATHASAASRSSRGIVRGF